MADKKKKKDDKHTDEVNVEEQQGEDVQADAKSQESSVKNLEQEISKLSQEKLDLHDLYVRKHAEFENYRKRVTKEKAETLQYANADLIEKLLDVLDNFDRAKKAAMEKNDLPTIMEGIEMIELSLRNLLISKGLTKLESTNLPFNPDQHQAIAMEESAEVEEAVVIEEFQPGYILHERLLRSAKVKVAMPKPKDAP